MTRRTTHVPLASRPAGMLAFVLMLVSLTAGAGAGTLRLLDGRVIEGELKLDNGLVIQPRSGPAVRATAEQVLHATFTDTADEPVLKRGVVFTNGSVLAVDDFRRSDTRTVRVFRNDRREIDVPAGRVSRMVFRPLPREAARLPDDRPGVVLSKGDFSQADFTSYDGGEVRTSSVLFGIQRFGVNDQAVAVVLRPVAATDVSQAEYAVRLRDASVLLIRAPKFEKDRLLVEDESAGAFSLASDQIVDIRVAGARVQPLTDLKAPRIEPSRGRDRASSFAMDGTTAGVPATLGNTPARGAIGLAAGASATWQLDGRFRAFTARVGVAAGVAPVFPVRFVVLADDKEIWRSPERTSVDEPLPVAVGLPAAGRITLRVEGAPVGPSAQGALFAEPLLVK